MKAELAWNHNASDASAFRAGSGAAAPVSVAFGHALYEQVRAAARRVSGCKPRAVTRHRRARR